MKLVTGIQVGPITRSRHPRSQLHAREIDVVLRKTAAEGLYAVKLYIDANPGGRLAATHLGRTAHRWTARPRQAIAAKGAVAFIPNNPSHAKKHPLDAHLFKGSPSKTTSGR